MHWNIVVDAMQTVNIENYLQLVIHYAIPLRVYNEFICSVCRHGTYGNSYNISVDFYKNRSQGDFRDRLGYCVSLT